VVPSEVTLAIQVHPGIDVTYYDAQEGGIMDATGWKLTSEHLPRLEQTVMMLPFSNSYAFACRGSQARPSPQYRSQVQMQQSLNLDVHRDLVFAVGVTE
jgi:hypothetical protein